MTDLHDELSAQLHDLVILGQLIHAKESLGSMKALQEKVDKQLAAAGTKATGKKKAAPAKPSVAVSKALPRIATQSFGKSYQGWYSTALRVVEQLLPDRLEEFRELHRPPRPVKQLDFSSYTVSDYVNGIVVTSGFDREPVFDAKRAGLAKLMIQIDIVESAQARLDFKLADIQGVIEARLLGDELSAARELLDAGYLRAAGAVAGVVLEHHLQRVMANHELTSRKKPTINNLNEALKAAEVYSQSQWRLIQRLGDIRNLCAHANKDEPARSDVEDLLSGVAKITAEVF